MMLVKYIDSEVLGMISRVYIINNRYRLKGDLKIDKHDLKLLNNLTPRNL